VVEDLGFGAQRMHDLSNSQEYVLLGLYQLLLNQNYMRQKTQMHRQRCSTIDAIS
jgi:hypothetical protein